jgi:thiamine kinase-like enzyme
VGLAIEEVVAMLWPAEDAHVAPLSGGITNANYRVEVGGESLVVRLPGSRTELLGIDRASELAASRTAAALGIGPELVLYDPERAYIVTRFIEGRHLDASEVGEDPVIGQIASALRTIHRAGAIEAAFNPFSLVPSYHALAASHGVAEPFDYWQMELVLDRISGVRPWRPAALCHNDLLTANLLHDGRIRIVDWEYAGMGDPFFDLGNLAVNHDFTPEQCERLLRAYFGDLDERYMAALVLFELVSEAREAMWGVVQMAISQLDVDFEGYAVEHGRGFFEVEAGLDLDELLSLTAEIGAA